MAAVQMTCGFLFTVVISMSVLQAFQNEENVSELGDKRFRDMESKFQNLLAQTKFEMDDKFASLLNDYVALTKRFEKIENDNMELRDSVSFLKHENQELNNRFLKLKSYSIREFNVHKCKAICKSERRTEEKHAGKSDNDEKLKNGSNFETHRQGLLKSKRRHMVSTEKRLLIPASSPSPSVPVPIPLHVAFHAQLSQHLTNVGDYQHIVFNKVITNDGDAYLGATSVFVCPVAGTYVFTWTILSFPDKYIETDIVLNGNAVGYAYSYNDHYYNSGSKMVILDLAEHDTVWIRVHGSGHNAGMVAQAPHSTFSGFILWSNY